MAKIGVVVLLAVLEAVSLLDVVLMAGAGVNPLVFILVAVGTAPWLAVESATLRRTSKSRRREPRRATVTTLTPLPAAHTGPVHTAATNPTGKRMAA